MKTKRQPEWVSWLALIAAVLYVAVVLRGTL